MMVWESVNRMYRVYHADGRYYAWHYDSGVWGFDFGTVGNAVEACLRLMAPVKGGRS